jgi:preprotein translocase subunit SecA
MQWVINEKILHFIPSIGAGAFVREQEQLRATHEQAKGIAEKEGSGTETQSQKPVVKSEEDKIGRNDPCYCGSGKKYKKCHGK